MFTQRRPQQLLKNRQAPNPNLPRGPDASWEELDGEPDAETAASLLRHP